MQSDTYWPAPGQVFSQLAGGWDFLRTVPGQASMRGKAVFSVITDLPDALAYHETGCLVLADGQTFEAAQRYRYCRRPEGFAIMFGRDPDRLFQTVILAREGDALAAEASHLCPPDRYRSLYRFDCATGGFSIRHAVTGPRKEYAIITEYTRARPPLLPISPTA
jgi:hypothetical protein